MKAAIAAANVDERAIEALRHQQAELAAIEEDVQTKSAQLGYLHSEYTINRNNCHYHYEPRLHPLLVQTYVAEQKEKFLAMQIAWLEEKTVQQAKRSHGRVFVEAHDMRPAAEELMKPAYQALLRSYQRIEECPEEDLRVISNYECPPDAAIETMELVMRVRGEEEADCTWEAAQVLLTYNYFHEFFTNRSESMRKRIDFLPESVMDELEQYCARPEHAVEALYSISAPIGCMGEWLHAIRGYYIVKAITAPALYDAANAKKNAKRARRWLNHMNFGDEAPLEVSEDDEQEAVVKRSDDKDGSAETEELRALMYMYNKSKESLSQSSRSGQLTQYQESAQQLREQLHRIKEGARSAEDEMQSIQKEIKAHLDEVRLNYDSAMVPLQEELEHTTDQFSDCVHQRTIAAPAPMAVD